MKRLFHALLLCASVVLLVAATHQKDQPVFLRILDASGQPVRGTSVERFYERQIIVTSFSGFTAGNPLVNFTMPSGTATATLANLQSGKQTLPSAVFTLTERGDATLNVTSTVRLEEVIVVSVSDAAGSTSVTLRASRIGTTYFQNNLKTGVRTVSGKTGYDFSRKQNWAAF